MCVCVCVCVCVWSVLAGSTLEMPFLHPACTPPSRSALPWVHQQKFRIQMVSFVYILDLCIARIVLCSLPGRIRIRSDVPT